MVKSHQVLQEGNRSGINSLSKELSLKIAVVSKIFWQDEEKGIALDWI